MPSSAGVPLPASSCSGDAEEESNTNRHRHDPFRTNCVRRRRVKPRGGVVASRGGVPWGLGPNPVASSSLLFSSLVLSSLLPTPTGATRCALQRPYRGRSTVTIVRPTNTGSRRPSDGSQRSARVAETWRRHAHHVAMKLRVVRSRATAAPRKLIETTRLERCDVWACVCVCVAGRERGGGEGDLRVPRDRRGTTRTRSRRPSGRRTARAALGSIAAGGAGAGGSTSGARRRADARARERRGGRAAARTACERHTHAPHTIAHKRAGRNPWRERAVG